MTDRVKTVCRLCAATCGMVATVEDGKVTALRGDRDHPLSRGYACIRGLQGHEAMNSPNRIARPLKRQPDGSFAPIPLETALDEIADKLRGIMAETGPETVALFKGTQAYKNVAGNAMINAWPKAIGSTRIFSTITIDQSAKQITMRRMGYWDAGKPQLDECDVLMVFGSNPLVSMTFTNLFNDPVKRLKAAIKRGMTLIVVDPRRCETAEFAQLFLQPRPGEDPALVSAMLQTILARGWHDEEFCERYVENLDALRDAVAAFTPANVERRCGVPAADIVEAARLFARANARGIAAAGTGPSMAPRSNLADHLIECLNVICGRVRREGQPVPNPGVQMPRRPHRAEVVPPFREWESSPTTGTGHGMIFGELMSGVLADEMLRTDGGRIWALFVHGGNPAAALPDQEKAVRALRNLDLMVAVDPVMTASAKLCDYILAPRMLYERTDTAIVPHYEPLLDMPFAQFAPAIAEPPPGSETADEWYFYWSICKRLGLPVHFGDVALDMEDPPTTEELVGIVLRHSQVPFETLKQYPGGKVFDVPPANVQPPREEAKGRFAVMPDDIAEELGEVLRENPAVEAQSDFPLLLSVRRLRGLVNSLGIEQPEIRKRHPVNTANAHPEDLSALGIADGEMVTIAAETGSIPARIEADPTMRRGVVSMSHCWGGLPDDGEDYEAVGASTNLLTRTDRFVEKINAMPRMTAIPIRIEKQRSVWSRASPQLESTA